MQFNPANTNISMVLKVDDLADTNATKYPLAQKARAFNTALDRAYSLIFSFTDTKNYDDRNFSTLPQGTYNIVSGERNITVLKDEDGAEYLPESVSPPHRHIRDITIHDMVRIREE